MAGRSPPDHRPHPTDHFPVVSAAILPHVSNVAQPPKINDTLGEYIHLDTSLFLDSKCWHDFYTARRSRTNFAPHLRRLCHRAASMLDRFSRAGVPVLLSSEPWTLQQKDAAMTRGNHPSALAFTTFLREEFADMRSKGMFLILPYDLVRHLPQLRLSPIGCIPQRDRRPRTIIDYTYSGINPSTNKMAPQRRCNGALPSGAYCGSFTPPIADMAQSFFQKRIFLMVSTSSR